MQAVVSGLLTTYQERGKGKDLLLLHGWGDDHKTFAGLGGELAKDYHVIALDLPGFGATQMPDSVWGLGDYAGFVADFINKLGIKPYAVIAHSNGGSVAIKGLATGEFETQKLVLLASAGIRDRQKVRKLATKLVAKVGKAATFWLPESAKRRLRKKLYGVAGSDMLAAPHLQETFKKTVRQDVQDDAKKLQVPTLLLYGQEDKATPPLYGEIYQNLIPVAELYILPRAGHFIHHDQQQEAIKQIKDFFSA